MSILEEIIVDNFAGGGGASTGIEMATGKPVEIAINHDPAAILLHKTNHPYTKHLQASVWDVDPVKECAGRSVGLAWFSPDCKHFSKAKGAALVDKKIRGLAWIVLRWAGTVRPRVIIVENVEEFTTWGPVRKGKPVKKKAGKTFKQWLKQLRDLGYQVEYRELVAADYGAPTTRKRFVLIARCDGNPIAWPERTYAPREDAEVLSGKLKPWRSAAEILEFSLPSYSIFASREEIKKKYGVNAVRPLAENTMRRIIRGVDKFTIKSGKPFIVQVGYGRGKIAPITVTNTTNSVGSTAGDPIHTITTAGNQMLVTPNLVQCNHSGGDRFQGIEQPLPTITSHHAFGVVSPSLIQYHSEGKSENARVNGIDDPLPTLDTSNRYGLTTVHLTEYYGNGQPLSLADPIHTLTSKDKEALTSVHIQKYFGGAIGTEITEPLPTVTAVDHNAMCAAHMVKFKGKNLGQAMEDPLQTITAESGGGGFAVCTALIRKMTPGAPCGHWPKIRALLNKHCGYQLADDEIILLLIGGIAYYIADISLRMLTPREQYSAMDFPPDYKIDRDYLGREYPKTQQTARCGNAVCPSLAAAVVRANFPEWCRTDITTMAQFHETVAV